MANWISRPIGCCSICFLFIMLVALTGGLLYQRQTKDPLCLSANFNDFKVRNSDIENNYIRGVLRGSTTYGSVRNQASRRRLNMDSDNELKEYLLQYNRYYGRKLLNDYTNDDWAKRCCARNYLQILFYSKGDDLLNDESLAEAKKVENAIKNRPGFQDRTVIANNGNGVFSDTPPSSFLNYIYPTVNGDQWILDGNGDISCCDPKLKAQELLDAQLVLGSELEVTWFDFNFGRNNLNSKYMVSIFPFAYADGESKDDSQKWMSEFYKTLDNIKGLDLIEFAYLDNGSLLTDEIFRALYGDLYLALLSFAMIFAVVWVYTRSLFISIFGLIGVLLSSVPALFFYHIFFGGSISIVNVVSAWIILGIGADDIFVFIASYRRAPLESLGGELIPSNIRMAYAYREAGSAMFVTSFTTSISFFSLCLSKISPLPQFGFFVGAMVIFNFLFVMTYFPCVLQCYIWMVQLSMRCHIISTKSKCIAKFIAVPVRIKERNEKVIHFDKFEAQKSFRVSHRSSGSFHGLANLENSPLPNKEGGVIVAHRQLSKRASANFLVAGAQEPGSLKRPDSRSPIDKARKLSRKLSRKLDKRGDNNKAADIGFSDFTNLYFIIMRRGLGICLLVTVFALTILFSITLTRIEPPEQTTQILPQDSNFGIVQSALEQVNVDTAAVQGYDFDNRVSPVAPVAPVTLRPTRNPTTPIPTNNPISPATLPTTPQPSQIPTSGTNTPTSFSPTITPSINPTINPTLNTIQPSSFPSQSPILNPTDVPTTSPIVAPTVSTNNPTSNSNPPTSNPSRSTTISPTMKPTDSPLEQLDPTFAPSQVTSDPTFVPSSATSDPTVFPTKTPTMGPTNVPTVGPTQSSQAPSIPPTINPTLNPTINPTQSSNAPSMATPSPTLATTVPTKFTIQPSINPSINPTMSPTAQLPDANSFIECRNVDTAYQELKADAVVNCTITVFPGAIIGDTLALFIEASNIQIATTMCGSSTIPTIASYNSIGTSYDFKWCYVDANLISPASRSFYISFTLPSFEFDWVSVSLAIYQGPGSWLKIANIPTQASNPQISSYYRYNNFTYVDLEYSDFLFQELNIDVAIDVSLIVGIGDVEPFDTACDGTQTGGKITFNSKFNVYDPETQSKLLYLCTALSQLQRDNSVIYRITEQDACFMNEFNIYLNDNGLSIPLPTKELFNQNIVDYLETEYGSRYRGHVTFADDPNANWTFNANESTITSLFQGCKTQISKNWGASRLEKEGYLPWKKFVDDFNKNHSLPWILRQSSSSYRQMEVELEFLRGFARSITTTVILCGVVMFFFTRNWYLVSLVCLYIVMVVVWIVGLFGLAQWNFGVIEIISVPTVVGLTIDYALHITHAYIHAPYPDRLRRAKSAVDTLGASVFASAMTTISAMIILYFAKIVIFSDLGWVVGATTTFGIFLALFVCPNVLMYCGPERFQCSCGWCLFCWKNQPKFLKGTQHWHDSNSQPSTPKHLSANMYDEYGVDKMGQTNIVVKDIQVSDIKANQNNNNNNNSNNNYDNIDNEIHIPQETDEGGTTKGVPGQTNGVELQPVNANMEDQPAPEIPAIPFSDNNNNDNENKDDAITTPAPPAPPANPDDIVPMGPNAVLTPGGNNNPKGFTPGGGNMIKPINLDNNNNIDNDNIMDIPNDAPNDEANATPFDVEIEQSMDIPPGYDDAIDISAKDNNPFDDGIIVDQSISIPDVNNDN